METKKPKKKMGAPGKYKPWLEPAGLEKITNWAAKGCSVAEIAHNCNVSDQTILNWMNKHEPIRDAIRRGREMSVQAVENALFRNALGVDAEGKNYTEEVTTETKVMPDGSVTTTKRITRARIKPQTSAQIFFLKNRAGYRDNPPDNQAPDSTPVDPLSKSLMERAKGLDDAER